MKVREAGTFSLLLIALAGCATRGHVRDQVAELEAKRGNLERLEQRLHSLHEAIGREAELLTQREREVAGARERALLAGDSSLAAQENVSGRLLGETVYWLEGLRFEGDSAELTGASRALLDQLAERLRIEDAGYFLEVRAGSGESGRADRELSLARAEAVRRYLHVDRGLPLHALSTLAAPGASVAGASRAPIPDESLAADEAAVELGSSATGGNAYLRVEPARESRIAVVVVRPFTRN